MTVATSIIDVNNGNAGWTKANVMDALETAFSQLGLNAGTEQTNVPQGCISPSGNFHLYGAVNADWYDANGGDQGPDYNYGGAITQSYIVTEVGTDYKLEKVINNNAPYYAGFVDTTTDEFIYTRHGFETGDAVKYAKGQTDTNFNVGTTVTIDTLYYVIKTSRDRFQIASSLANANNGTQIDLDGNSGSSSTIDVWTQEAQQASDYINPTITIYMGDTVEFQNAAGNSTNLTACMNTDSFNNNQRIVYQDATYGSYPVDETSISYRQNVTNISCVPGANLTWNTSARPQTEAEPTVPASELNPSFTNEPGEDGTVKYIYCSEDTATAKGEIVLIPGFINHSTAYYGYWKYTVPASGSRSELKLRIWRYGYNNGRLGNVTIHSIGSGWNAQEVFTIPGEAVGFNATTGDIRFGVRTPETSSNAYDGIAEINTTTLGAGSTMFQKNENFAVLKVENDSSKKYRYGYYCLTLKDEASTNWKLFIGCGSGWDWMNRAGTASNVIDGTNLGAFSGYQGLDWQSSQSGPTQSTTNYWNVSNNSTPTSYPLQIRTYRAQAPQDTNFFVIQFCSVINGIVSVNSTFTLCVGDGYGAGTFDLDDVFLGGVVSYESYGGSDLEIKTYMPGYTYAYYSSRSSPNEEPVSTQSQARSAFYGYMRGYNSANYMSDVYTHNIKTSDTNASSVYYRNSTYDKYNNKGVDSNADWFKPIKTIPLSQKMIPCPYYIPDDFTILQVATTPGLISFRPGDTVTIDTNEVYKIILASYESQQTGFDGIANNTTTGTLFLARTT